MDIPKAKIEKYMELHEKRFNEKISFQDAKARFEELVNFYLLIGRPVPNQDENALDQKQQ